MNFEDLSVEIIKILRNIVDKCEIQNAFMLVPVALPKSTAACLYFVDLNKPAKESQIGTAINGRIFFREN